MCVHWPLLLLDRMKFLGVPVVGRNFSMGWVDWVWNSVELNDLSSVSGACQCHVACSLYKLGDR